MCTCIHKGPTFHCRWAPTVRSHIGSPLPNWNPPLARFHQSWIYMVSKKYSGKADQLTLASGGSEYAELFSVAID